MSTGQSEKLENDLTTRNSAAAKLRRTLSEHWTNSPVEAGQEAADDYREAAVDALRHYNAVHYGA